MKSSSNKNNFIIRCGKLGILQFNKLLYKKFGFTEEEISKLLKTDSLTLKEGCYTISTNIDTDNVENNSQKFKL